MSRFSFIRAVFEYSKRLWNTPVVPHCSFSVLLRRPPRTTKNEERMCGINAIYAFHPSAPLVDEAELTCTREAMRLRGPDASGMWISDDRRVGLAHRRLSIIDVSDRANQPMHSPEGDLAIVFNGEI